MASYQEKRRSLKNNACKPLSNDLKNVLRSGVAITSVVQCVEELVYNAIDAEATEISITVDLDSFRVKVEDNGVGISKADFDIIGVRHTTSKCSTLTDLNNLHYFGYRGEALASIIDISAGVELYTRTTAQGSSQPYYKKFKNGRPSGTTQQVSDSKRPTPGFTIIVHNLLSKLPVRQKRIDSNLEAEEIKKSLEQIYLISPNLHLIFEINGRRIFQTYPVKSVSEGLKQTFIKLRESSIHECFFNYDCFFIQGWFTQETHHSKSLQFVYVNKRFVGRCRIHRSVDSDLSEVIGLGSAALAKSTNPKKNPKGKDGGRASPRGPEKYAIFVLNIQSPYSEYDMTLEPKKSLVEFKNWSTVLKGLEGIILKFKAELSAENKGLIVKSQSASGSNRQKLQGEVGNLGTIHDMKRAVYSRVARRERGPGSPVFDSEGEDSPLATGAHGFKSKACHNSSDEEEIKSPEVGPSKRSKLDQFKPKDKLRLGTSSKPKPVDMKLPRRRKSEEPVIHGYKKMRLSNQHENGAAGAGSKSQLESINEKASSLRRLSGNADHVEPRKPPWNPLRLLKKSKDELGSHFSRLSVSAQNSEYQFDMENEPNDTTERGRDSFQGVNGDEPDDRLRARRKSQWDESDDDEQEVGKEGSGARADPRFHKNPMIQIQQSIAEDQKPGPPPCPDLHQIYKPTNAELSQFYNSTVSSTERFHTSQVIINAFMSTAPGNEFLRYSTLQTTYGNEREQHDTNERSPRYGMYLSPESLSRIQNWLSYTIQYPNNPDFSPRSSCPFDTPFADMNELERYREAGHSYFKSNPHENISQESSQELMSFSQRANQQQFSQPQPPEPPPPVLPQVPAFDFTCPLGFPDSLIAPTPAPFRTRPSGGKNSGIPHTHGGDQNLIQAPPLQPFVQPLQPLPGTSTEQLPWSGFTDNQPFSVASRPFTESLGVPFQLKPVSSLQTFRPPAPVPQMNLVELRPTSRMYSSHPAQKIATMSSNNFQTFPQDNTENMHIQTAFSANRMAELSRFEGEQNIRFQSGFSTGRQTELSQFATTENPHNQSAFSSSLIHTEFARMGGENSNFRNGYSTGLQSEVNRIGQSQYFSTTNSNSLGTSFDRHRPPENLRQSSGYNTADASGLEFEESAYFERSPVPPPNNTILNPFSIKKLSSSLPKFELTPTPASNKHEEKCDASIQPGTEKQESLSAESEFEGVSKMETETESPTSVAGEAVSTYFPPSAPVTNFKFVSTSPRNGLPPLHPFKPNSDLDGEWTDDQIFDTSTSWTNWECDVITDAFGQEWLVTEDKEGYQLYINLKTGASSYDMRSRIEPRRLTAKEAAEINPNFSYNWLRRYFPKGSKFWKPEKSHLLKNGKMELARNGNTILGPGIQQCLNGTLDEAVASKWREGVLMEAQNLTSAPDKGIVRVTEYWERPLGSAELPVINLNAPEIHFWKSITSSCRFSKEDLTRVKVLGQVDKKFIAAKARVQPNSDTETELLVLFDQHAVHERIRLEALMAEIYVETSNGTKEISSVCIMPPILLSFSETEIRIMTNYSKDLEGIGIKLEAIDSRTVSIFSAPKCFAEKIENEVKATRDDTISRLIHGLLQEQVQHIIDIKGPASTMPKTIFNILCSQACRGAIKFGDNLSQEACEELISKLKDCKMPFQCAHGRPVLTPLLDLKSVEPNPPEYNPL